MFNYTHFLIIIIFLFFYRRGINKEHNFDFLQTRRKRVLGTSDPTLNKF